MSGSDCVLAWAWQALAKEAADPGDTIASAAIQDAAPLLLSFPKDGPWKDKAHLAWGTNILQAELKPGDCFFLPAGYIPIPRFTPSTDLAAGFVLCGVGHTFSIPASSYTLLDCRRSSLGFVEVGPVTPVGRGRSSNGLRGLYVFV